MARPRWLTPPLLVATLTVGVAASWTLPGQALLAVAGGSYLLFLTVAAGKLARGGEVSRIDLALALATMQLSWGSGFVVSALGVAAERLPLRRRRR